MTRMLVRQGDLGTRGEAVRADFRVEEPTARRLLTRELRARYQAPAAWGARERGV